MLAKLANDQPILLSELFDKYGLMDRYSFAPERITPEIFSALSDDIVRMSNLTQDTRFTLIPLIASAYAEHSQIRKLSAKLRETEVQGARLATENRNLAEKAYTDALTKAFNRQYFVEALEAEVQSFNNRRTSRQNKPSAVVFIDLRKFKPINDIFGHEAGDEALKKVAELLKKEIRDGDIVARWGGDEFVILIKNIDAADSQQVFARLEKALDHIEFKYKEQKISFSARLGKVKIEPGKKPEEIMHEADMMMINSKDPRDRQGAAVAIEASIKGPNP